jgi:F-type H+-transporting ATPase subunit delta
MDELAEVYARALFDVAQEQGKLDELREQLRQFSEALRGDRRLATFFFSPYLSVAEKLEGLRAGLVGADPIFVNFLTVLVEKHRMPVIYRIGDEYERLWEDANRLLSVEITSAVELDPELTESLGRQIGEGSGRRVRLAAHVDPEIIGGIVLRVGNSILDASIRNRLEQLRRQVAQGAA